MHKRWRPFYGDNPLHLLSLLACFGLTGYAALQASRAPKAARMLVWFVGAIVAHDLVLYPLYALADRSVRAALHRRSRSPATRDPADVNYLRVPVVLSGVTFLIFSPVITSHSEPSYRFASGMGTSVYLGHWLLVSGVSCAVSAVLYAVHLGRRAR